MILVIGIGNPYRRDDAVGIQVAEAISTLGLPGVKVHCESGEGAALMQSWEGYQSVIVIDALQSTGTPGNVSTIAAHSSPVPVDYFRYSSHAFGLAEAIEVSRSLGLLPNHLYVVGVEGANFSTGLRLTPEVAEAVTRTVHEVVKLTRICMAESRQDQRLDMGATRQTEINEPFPGLPYAG